MKSRKTAMMPCMMLIVAAIEAVNTYSMAAAFSLPSAVKRSSSSPRNWCSCYSSCFGFRAICNPDTHPFGETKQTTKLFMAFSGSLEDLERMTVTELKQLLKDSNLNQRGLMTRLKRKKDLVEYLQQNLSTENLQEQRDDNNMNCSQEAPTFAQYDGLNGSTDTDTRHTDDDYAVPDDSSYQDYVERFEALLANISPRATTVTEVEFRQEQAQKIFDEMYESFIFGSEHLEPQVDIYNLLIRVYGIPIRPNTEMAQLILDRMLNALPSDDENAPSTGGPSPNIDTFILVMETWAHDNKPEKAEEVFEQLRQHLELNTEAYNTLIKAWLKSTGDDIHVIKGARAESILRTMLEEYKDGNEAVKPNVKTWERVIKCVASERDNESTLRAMELFEELKDLALDDPSLSPDTELYNSVIRAVSNNRDAPNKYMRGVIAESILNEMIEVYKSGKVEARPHVGAFINCIHAYRGSPDPKSSIKAEKLLELLDAMSKDEDNQSDANLAPNTKVYNTVLDVVGRTRDPTKARHAQRILNRMVEGNVTPDVRSYNAILNACAYTQSKEPELLLDAFRVAVDTINHLRDIPTLQPDSVSYGLFLKSCARLMPRNRKRNAVVEKMFLKCCMDGQVSDFVLQSLFDAAPPELYQKLTRNKGSGEDWSRNVIGRNRQRMF